MAACIKPVRFSPLRCDKPYRTQEGARVGDLYMAAWGGLFPLSCERSAPRRGSGRRYSSSPCSRPFHRTRVQGRLVSQGVMAVSFRRSSEHA